MPTENRSSNTDVLFQREDRYIVIKRSDLDKLSPIDRDLALSSLEHVDSIMATWDCPARKCLVIESDWPEYEPTWAAIEARVTGKPAEQHQGKPIMLTAVAELVDDGDGGLEARWLLEGGTAELFAGMTLLVADNAPDLCSEDGSAEVYTHADPGEVERLRDDLDECDGERWKLRNERDTLRAQLAERDALLEEAYRDGWNDGQEAIEQRYQTTPRTSTDGWERFKAANALSASAKPSAPVERDALSPDEINQMAFEEGQPAEGGDGYTFTQEEFDLFVQRLLDRAALEHKPAGADDLAAFNAAFQKAMETGWDDPIDLARQLWNARGQAMSWEQWWEELVALAAKNGHTPGMPELWKEYNWARGQTPQEAYQAEYSLDF
ncbi:hypothetical protein NJI34_28430 [Pseudomonas sp. S 311-6]|uniref:hypothetical protein n=1 Tax=Pseudomonas TaxID=286 RepID=UPI002097DB58|nr:MULTISPECIES: hypothetical protein [Pseudomonas]MCO7566396.1 hypothetical protein [Pseudomonas mosselii]MCO7617424.1 hypothetical protein [Pseudomonas guariconensis]MCO7640702.1 hypothetical protein [Pseudomonas sp. S 311-6]